MDLSLHGWHLLFYVFCLITLIQLVYLWVLFRHLAFYEPPEREKTQQHPVSIVICARDEALNLKKNLPGILSQSYSSTHEIVVVNHNSQDETRYLLDEFRKAHRGLQVVNLHQEAMNIPGKKYPLSIGIREAKHEILLLTDADCTPATDQWTEKMQSGYDNGTEIVLGYGAYYKKPGLLNKLIRFETFHTALQYLSCALAGVPYMGVGRNLSYKKELFFRNKGFSSINHIAGGDDDLFVNKVANSHNTRVVLDPEAFTYSEPKTSWNSWIRQKRRHVGAGKFYRPAHKYLLGLYSFSHFLFYPLFVACLFLNWQLALIVFGIRFVSQGIIYNKAMKRLQENDLFIWWWLLDVWMFLYYCIFAPVLWRKPRKTWN